MGRRPLLTLALLVALVASGCTPGANRGPQVESASPSVTTTPAAPEGDGQPTEPSAPDATTTTATPTPSTEAPRPTEPPPASPADASAGEHLDDGPARARLGRIVADLGFRPDQQGFPFENYGNRLPDGDPPTNLTVDDLRRLFGDQVCLSTANGECELIPSAGAWLDQTNKQMAGGHCYGFAVSALLLWRQMIAAQEYGASVPPALDINDNTSLQRRIATEWTAQLLDAVRTNVLGGTPNEVLAFLTEQLRPDATEVYTLAFWKTDGTGGHAVTPFAVEDRGGGEFSVLIYDSNWPGQTRAIKFDTNDDTWTYAAAANPEERQSLYTGSTKSRNLSLYPLSPGLGIQPCPFCGTRAIGADAGPTARAVVGATAEPMQEVSLVGSHAEHPDLLITDDGGRRLGYVKGRLVQEIPGARVDLPLANQSWRVKLAPRFVVPADRRYTIRLDGSRLRKRQTETLSVIGPAFNLTVVDIPLRPGDRDVLVLGHHGENVTYSTNRSRTPKLRIGISEPTASYELELQGVAADKGTALQLGFPFTGGTMTLRNFGAVGTSVVGLQLTRRSPMRHDAFLNHSILLYGDARGVLDYGAWGGRQSGMPWQVTDDGTTTTRTLSNELS